MVDTAVAVGLRRRPPSPSSRPPSEPPRPGRPRGKSRATKWWCGSAAPVETRLPRSWFRPAPSASGTSGNMQRAISGDVRTAMFDSVERSSRGCRRSPSWHRFHSGRVPYKQRVPCRRCSPFRTLLIQPEEPTRDALSSWRPRASSAICSPPHVRRRAVGEHHSARGRRDRQLSGLGWLRCGFSKNRSSSTGKGSTRVEFFSAATSTTVRKSRNCSAARRSAITAAACTSLSEACHATD